MAQDDETGIEVEGGGDSEALRMELKEAKEAAEANLNKLKYLMADFDNYRKQMEKQVASRVESGKAELLLKFLNIRDGGVYIDGTFGAGGYTRMMLDAANAKVIGIDRDQKAVAGGFGLVEASAGRLTAPAAGASSLPTA